MVGLPYGVLKKTAQLRKAVFATASFWHPCISVNNRCLITKTFLVRVDSHKPNNCSRLKEAY